VTVEITEAAAIVETIEAVRIIEAAAIVVVELAAAAIVAAAVVVAIAVAVAVAAEPKNNVLLRPNIFCNFRIKLIIKLEYSNKSLYFCSRFEKRA
jgi:hypothetical protein